MEPYSSLSFLISIFLLLSPFFNPSNCQQTYLNNTQLDCQKNPSISKGYLCNGLETSCQSFITFRSQPPYDSPIRIAYLLGSEASGITSINNISSNNDTIPPGKLVIIPVSCSCSSGSIYQHNTPYTIKSNETYLSIANNTYQGLTTCQALMGQNYYDELSLEPGLQLTVPLRCACPSANQTANGVSSLLAYMVTWVDTIGSMTDLFGVDEKSILEANKLSQDSNIYPFTPLLIPLKSESCSKNPEKFFCYCPADGSLDGISYCKTEGKKFPVKLVTLLAKENKVMEILDARVAKEASEEDIRTIVELALSCLRLSGKKRPTMKHVALELEGLRRSQRCLEIKQDLQVLNDEISMNGQESITNSLVFPLKMESPSL
ncbi:hypothetical protein Patl1_24341 [Pistacia atlantica]|uniref:Uncharacterized protein n=1 Tax=Pistacia atlantica TaxID=434234 RepID=A0ACC0ZZX7_9ROSI|nr:hypothetical protein Patl1_24341 [Pistacia atlantica]